MTTEPTASTPDIDPPPPPFLVTLEVRGLMIRYTLAREHLDAVHTLLQDCHALDDAKERLGRAMLLKQKLEGAQP